MTTSTNAPHLPRLAAAMARRSEFLSVDEAETVLYLYRAGIDYGEMSAKVWTRYRLAWRTEIQEAVRRRHERVERAECQRGIGGTND